MFFIGINAFVHAQSKLDSIIEKEVFIEKKHIERRVKNYLKKKFLFEYTLKEKNFSIGDDFRSHKKKRLVYSIVSNSNYIIIAYLYGGRSSENRLVIIDKSKKIEIVQCLTLNEKSIMSWADVLQNLKMKKYDLAECKFL